jgi:protein-disulfide isomerase
MADLKSLSLALALGLLTIVAPTLVSAQEPPPSDAPSDQADMAPAAELKIDEPFGHAWLGAADADITLVIFADYACPGCRGIQPVIDELLAADPKLRIVYRVLDNDQGGRTAALTSLAVAKVSADWTKFHHALEAGGDPDAKALAAALAAAGVDPAKLPIIKDDDPEGVALGDELARNDLFINQRKGTAIPCWVIGDDPAEKGFDLPRLQAAIAKARAGKAR